MRVGGCVLIILCMAVIVLAQNEDRFAYQVVAGSGFVDGTGKIVIPPKYTQVRQFHEGVAVVLRDEKWGYVDRAGTEVVPPIYQDASDFSEGVGLVMDKDGHIGYIDHQWHMKVLDCIPVSDDPWSFAPPPFSEGLTEFRSGQETVYIDHACNRIVVQAGAGEPFREGLAPVRLGQKSGYIDHSGKMIIPMRFSFGCQFHEGLACVDIEGGRGYIDRSGKIVIQPQFGPHSGSFSEGIAPVQIEEKMGYIDKTGKIVIPARFDEAYEFSEGVAQVRNQVGATTMYAGSEIKKSKDDIFFIDHSGKPAIAEHFEFIWGDGFNHGLVQVQVHGHDTFINRQGVFVLPH